MASVSTKVNYGEVINLRGKMYVMWSYLYMKHTKIFKKIMDGNLSDVQSILKFRQYLDSFSTHYEKLFYLTTPCTDICKWMEFKVANKINPIE